MMVVMMMVQITILLGLRLAQITLHNLPLLQHPRSSRLLCRRDGHRRRVAQQRTRGLALNLNLALALARARGPLPRALHARLLLGHAPHGHALARAVDLDLHGDVGRLPRREVVSDQLAMVNVDCFRAGGARERDADDCVGEGRGVAGDAAVGVVRAVGGGGCARGGGGGGGRHWQGDSRPGLRGVDGVVFALGAGGGWGGGGARVGEVAVCAGAGGAGGRRDERDEAAGEVRVRGERGDVGLRAGEGVSSRTNPGGGGGGHGRERGDARARQREVPRRAVLEVREVVAAEVVRVRAGLAAEVPERRDLAARAHGVLLLLARRRVQARDARRVHRARRLRPRRGVVRVVRAGAAAVPAPVEAGEPALPPVAERLREPVEPADARRRRAERHHLRRRRQPRARRARVVRRVVVVAARAAGERARRGRRRRRVRRLRHLRVADRRVRPAPPGPAAAARLRQRMPAAHAADRVPRVAPRVDVLAHEPAHKQEERDRRVRRKEAHLRAVHKQPQRDLRQPQRQQAPPEPRMQHRPQPDPAHLAHLVLLALPEHEPKERLHHGPAIDRRPDDVVRVCAPLALVHCEPAREEADGEEDEDGGVEDCVQLDCLPRVGGLHVSGVVDCEGEEEEEGDGHEDGVDDDEGLVALVVAVAGSFAISNHLIER
ncbi:hypothetical protein DFH27DRAFT_540579 [Peziza echinospora]|nr:hypothetical protein DFH27DRAFT_540579 [Peziza echinospora]